MNSEIQILDDGRTATARATIRNSAGIHCRPSAVVVKAMRKYDDAISLRSHDSSIDPRSAIELLSLGLEKGSTVNLRVEGATAETCCRELVELLEKEYDFPPKPRD